MSTTKDRSILNCIGTALLAIFLTVPVHELFHLLTDLAYGSTLTYYSAGAVDAIHNVDFNSLSVFDQIMLSGGSASIINTIIAVVLLIILIKVKMGPMVRLFLTQLMGAQFVQGIGYFLIGGLFGAGDWGNVYNTLELTHHPEMITTLQIVLSIIGCAGIVLLFFILNYMSYYFIEDRTDKKERRYVAFRLHLIILILGFAVGMIASAMSPAIADGYLTMGTAFLFNFMWIPFFWGFMFTGFMVRPPKKSRFLYHLPTKPNYVLFIIAVALILVDIIVFGPGIQFT